MPYWIVWDRLTALEVVGLLIYQDDCKRYYHFDHMSPIEEHV